MNDRLTALLLDATILTVDITPPVELGEINTISKAGISLHQLKLNFKDATHPVTLMGSPTVNGTLTLGQEMLQLTGGLAAVQKSSGSGSEVSGSLSINPQIEATPISQMVFYNPKAGLSTRMQCGKTLTELPVASESCFYGIHAHKSGQFVMANM